MTTYAFFIESVCLTYLLQCVMVYRHQYAFLVVVYGYFLQRVFFMRFWGCCEVW